MASAGHGTPETVALFSRVGWRRSACPNDLQPGQQWHGHHPGQCGGGAGTDLVINDAVAGFQPGNDLIVNLTGHSGVLPAVGTVAVRSWFV